MSPTSVTFLSFTLLLHLILPISIAVDVGTVSPAPSPPAISPTVACKTSIYPKLCRYILSPYRSTSLRDYGRFSIKKALKHARQSATLINSYIERSAALPSADAGALDDCRFLSGLNSDYLDAISTALSSTSSLGSTDEVRTLLSAIVTNQQTCYDGLMVAPGRTLKNDLGGQVSSDVMLYSVSLAVVTNALSANRHSGRELAGSVAADMQSKVMIREWVTVAKDGSGNFSTISDAVEAAPNNTLAADGYYVIYVKKGTYHEYVLIGKNKKNVMMVGDGINKTVITGDRSVGDGWTTFNSATFAVVGERFVAMGMTIRNTAGPAKHQAVAVRNSADLSAFYRCSFEGYQDTLYVHSLRQFYRNCDIYGTVDFIFGNAAACFQTCNLYARKAMDNQKNAITAQGRTDPNQNTGISIQNCNIKPSPEFLPTVNTSVTVNATNGNVTENVGVVSFTPTFLGRPWKNYSRTVYMQSHIDGFVDPAGWLAWNGDDGLDTLYYGEYKNTGAGANTTGRVNWGGFKIMNSVDAINFTVSSLIMGNTWLPARLVPFSSGL